MEANKADILTKLMLAYVTHNLQINTILLLRYGIIFQQGHSQSLIPQTFKHSKL